MVSRSRAQVFCPQIRLIFCCPRQLMGGPRVLRGRQLPLSCSAMGSANSSPSSSSPLPCPSASYAQRTGTDRGRWLCGSRGRIPVEKPSPAPAALPVDAGSGTTAARPGGGGAGPAPQDGSDRNGPGSHSRIRAWSVTGPSSRQMPPAYRWMPGPGTGSSRARERETMTAAGAGTGRARAHTGHPPDGRDGTAPPATPTACAGPPASRGGWRGAGRHGGHGADAPGRRAVAARPGLPGRHRQPAPVPGPPPGPAARRGGPAGPARGCPRPPAPRSRKWRPRRRPT